MHVVPVEPRNRRQVNRFLELPFRLYRDVSQWVPPLRSDVRLMLDCRRHPFYQHSDAAFFLALDGERAPGRLAVLDHRHYNAFNHTAKAFFFLFECEEDPPAAQALFEAAFAWARARGLTQSGDYQMMRSIIPAAEPIVGVRVQNTVWMWGYWRIFASHVTSGQSYTRAVATMIWSAGSRWKSPGNRVDSTAMAGVSSSRWTPG